MNDTYTYENYEDKPLIKTGLLEGNERAELSGLQETLAPHVDLLVLVWTTVLIVTLSIVILKGIILPLVRGQK